MRVRTTPDASSDPDPEAPLRALLAAGIGLVAAVALVFVAIAIGPPEGETSPRPLLTTVPSAPGR